MHHGVPASDLSLLIIPQNVECSVFEGFITVCDQDFRIKIKLKSPPMLKNASLFCEWKLKELISGYEEVLQKRLEQSQTLGSFLIELKSIINNCLKLQTDLSSPNLHTDKIRRDSSILKELDLIGLDKLLHLSDDFHVCKLCSFDNKKRTHAITISLEAEQSLNMMCITDLPIAFSPRSNQQQKGWLKLIYDQFDQTINYFQSFWDNLEEIDQTCWILEPEHFSYGCTYRKIAVAKNVSIYVKFNPYQPNEFPEYRVLGPDNMAKSIKEKINKNGSQWNTSNSALKNLEMLLGIEFPSPSTVSMETIQMDCGICYAYRLNDELPEQHCDNLRCEQIFHRSCLYEWLRSLPNFRQSFNVAFGECPYCNNNIMVNLK